MSSDTATGALSSQIASNDATATRRKAAGKCQLILGALYDSHDGFIQCSADTKDTAMKLLFETIAASRASYIAQLSNVVKVDLGVEPVTSGSALGAAYRIWIDVKSWFTDGRDKSVIISEVHRGEQILIKLYEAATEDNDFSVSVRDLLHGQLKAIKEENASVDTI